MSAGHNLVVGDRCILVEDLEELKKGQKGTVAYGSDSELGVQFDDRDSVSIRRETMVGNKKINVRVIYHVDKINEPVTA